MNTSPDFSVSTSAQLATEGRRQGLTVLAGGLAAAAGAGLAFRLELSPGAPAAAARAAPPVRTGRIPDVPLTTHDGRPVRFYSDLVQGRTVLLSMMYTQCSERCPPMTQNLRAVQEALGDRVGRDIFIYSITLLPEFDRPADLKAYRELNRIGPGWTFLTGAKADVERLRFAIGFYDPDPTLDADLGQHIGMVRVGNDALDRWCMTPLLSQPHLILESLMAVDPVSRARGRTWHVPAQA
jgi:protein SCO1/2